MTERRQEIVRNLDFLGIPERLARAAHKRGELLVQELRKPRNPTWLFIHVGGASGRVYRVNRSPLYALGDVQVLIARRNYLTRQRLVGGRVEVRADGGPAGVYGYVFPDPNGADESLLTMQMIGVLDNLVPRDPSLLARHMRQAVFGATFAVNHRGIPPRRHMNGNGNGNGYE